MANHAVKPPHGKMVEIVDMMLELNKQRHSGKLALSQIERIDRGLAAGQRDRHGRLGKPAKDRASAGTIPDN